MEHKRELPRDTEFFSLDGQNIQDEHAFTEIANAVLHLSNTLRRCGFEPPRAIELASHKDGYRMRHILPRDLIIATVAENRDGGDDVLFNICGVEFRYPAQYRRQHSGGFDTA